MVKIIYILILCFSSFYEQSNRNYIKWNVNYKLNWKDFQEVGLNNENVISDTLLDVNSSLGIECLFNKRTGNKIDTFSFDIYAYFDKSMSYSKVKSDSLLSIERLRFNIAELFARKLRKIILSNPNKYISDTLMLRSECKKIINECSLYQYDFDNSPDDLYTRNIYIANELNEYKDYSSNLIEIVQIR